MQYTKITFMISLVFFLSFVSADYYQIDPHHTQVTFKVRHMGICWIAGNFTKFEGHLEWNAKSLKTLQVNIKIKTKSIYTGVNKRDNHLRSSDFFHAEKYPNIIFSSEKVVPGKNYFKVYGKLTMRGVTKDIVLKAKFDNIVKRDPWGNQRIGFFGRAEINRHDFGISWNTLLETGMAIVGSKVMIYLRGEGIKREKKE